MTSVAPDTGVSAPAPRLRELIRIRAFAVLYAAEVQSVAGDQLARVALSVLVFERTGSAAATALAYATTFLPAILGGMVLARIADRHSLRSVLVGCDLVRAAAFGAMAIPAVPLPAVIALLVLAIFVSPAHTAAQVSYLSVALGPEQFRAATGLRLATGQAAQVLGFAFGGGIVAATGPRDALLIDAVTFLAAAALTGGLLPTLITTRRRPRPGPVSVVGPVAGSAGIASAAGAGQDPGLLRRRMRTAVGLCWLQGFFVVPEGLAVPFGASSGATTTQIGLLLAALPFGGAVGAIALTRGVPVAKRRWISRLMAVGTGIPLVFTGAHLPLGVVFIAWAMSGALGAYQVELMSEIVLALRSEERARSVGRISAGLITAQGVGLAAFGGLAQLTDPQVAVAGAGASGVVAAVTLALTDPARSPVHASRLMGNAEPSTSVRQRRPLPRSGTSSSARPGGSEAPVGGHG